MGEDSFTEVTDTSWIGRIGGALKGLVFGLILFAGAFVLLFWNEGRSVKRHQTLKEGEGAAVSIPSDRVDPANEGRLVCVSDLAATDEMLSDPVFDIELNALRLKRKVEMYQWEEEKETEKRKKAGGGSTTRTTYSYHKTWSEDLIRSSTFKRPEGHQNPESMPFASKAFTARAVSLGAFRLPTSLVKKIDIFSKVDVQDAGYRPPAVGEEGMFYDGGFYIGSDPSSPRIGDVRVTFHAVAPMDVTVVVQQVGDSFQPYQTQTGGKITLLDEGLHSLEKMFASAHRSNLLLTWILRLVGWLLMFLGLLMLFKPLSVLADVIPLLGGIMALGTRLISLVVSAVLSLVTIGVAWIFYRPVIACLLFGASLGLIGILFLRQKQKKNGPHTRTPEPGSVFPPLPEVPTPRTGSQPASAPLGIGQTKTKAAVNASEAEMLERGKVHFKAGNYPKAVEAFSKAADKNPDSAPAHFNLAVVRVKMGRTESAVEGFKRAARLGHMKAREYLTAKRISWEV